MDLLNPTKQQKIGYIISTKRKRLGISQSDFAKICNMSQVTISHLENGQFTNVTTLMTVLEKLNLDILIEDKDNLISKKPIKF